MFWLIWHMRWSAGWWHVTPICLLSCDKKILKLSDVTPQIRNQLENQARQDAMQKEIDRLKKKYAVTIKP